MDTKRKRLYIILASVLIWAVSVYFGYVSYDVNDDAGMNLIAAGAYGPMSQYLIHSNVVHGLALKLLYMIFPFINCYLWLFLVCNLVAVIAISIVVTDKFSNYVSVVLTVGINLLFAGDYYVHLQFTKNSALYAAVGLVVLIWQMKKANREKSMILLSYFLIILGLNVRWESFLLVLPIVLGALIVDELFELVIRKKKIDFKKYSLAIAPFVICVVIAVINHFAYYSNPGWQEYRRTEEVLSPMRDFNKYVFNDSPEEYLEAGFTQTDFDMIKGYWMWGDTEQFSADRLERLSAIGEKYSESYIRFDASFIKYTIKEVISAVTGKHIAMAVAIVLLIAIIAADLNIILQMLYMVVVGMAEIYYLFCLERVLWRAEIVIWVTVLLMGGYLTSTLADKLASSDIAAKEMSKRSYVFSYVGIALLIVLLILVKSLAMDNSRFTNGDNRSEEFKELTQADAHFLCYNKAAYGVLQGADNIFAIDRSYAGYYSNITDLGSGVLAPVGQYYARQKGITNPIKALFERDDVYYVGEEAPMKCLGTFISEKYDIEVSWEPVTFGRTTAWKCVKN